MGKVKHIVLLCSIILGMSTSLYGYTFFQETPSPPSTIKHSAKYNQGDGMLTNCIQEAFIDSNGRLWLNPCEITAEGFSFSFFQYDGVRSYRYTIRPPWLASDEDQPIWYAVGEDKNDFLYGMDADRSILFNWHPDTKEQFFYRLKQGQKLLNLTEHPQGGVLVLVETGNTYQVHHWNKGRMKLLSAIQLDFPAKRLSGYPYPFEANDHTAYFFHQAEGLVKVDLNSGVAAFLPWVHLTDKYKIVPFPYDERDRLKWLFKLVDNNRILLFLGQENGLFSLDTSSETLVPLEDFNSKLTTKIEQKYFKFYFGEDDKNNTLLIWGYIDSYNNASLTNETGFQAWILDQDGNWLDYSDKIIEEGFVPDLEWLDYPKKFISQDFKHQLGWITQEGIYFIEFQPALDIKKFPFITGVRGITPVNEDKILINSDMMFNYLMDLNKDTSSFYNTKFITRPLSSIIRNKDTIWMALYPKGIGKYNIGNGQIDQYETGISSDKFTFIDQDRILLFSLKGDVYTYTISTNNLQPFEVDGKPLTLENNVNQLLWVNEDTLWVGAINGLWELDVKNKSASKIQHLELLRNTNVLCINQNENGDFWMGTGSKGILVYNPKEKTVKQISTAQGLSNNTVVGILKDDEGYLWAATFDGITVLNKEGIPLFDLGISEGILDYEFNRTSYRKLPNGKLVFGGLHGFIVLNPKQIIEIHENRIPREIYLTSLEYFDSESKEELQLYGNYVSNEPIKIPANHRYLGLDFAVSEYTDLDEHRYSYRLVPEELSKEEVDRIPWIDLGSQSKVLINNIPTGKYRVQVLGVDHQSSQSIAPLEIPVEVDEFFYKKI